MRHSCGFRGQRKVRFKLKFKFDVIDAGLQLLAGAQEESAVDNNIGCLIKSIPSFLFYLLQTPNSEALKLCRSVTPRIRQAFLLAMVWTPSHVYSPSSLHPSHLQTSTSFSGCGVSVCRLFVRRALLVVSLLACLCLLKMSGEISAQAKNAGVGQEDESVRLPLQ